MSFEISKEVEKRMQEHTVTLRIDSKLLAEAGEGSTKLQEAESRGLPAYQVIACIAGRGFGVRRADMRHEPQGGIVLRLASSE